VSCPQSNKGEKMIFQIDWGFLFRLVVVLVVFFTVHQGARYEGFEEGKAIKKEIIMESIKDD